MITFTSRLSANDAQHCSQQASFARIEPASMGLVLLSLVVLFGVTAAAGEADALDLLWPSPLLKLQDPVARENNKALRKAVLRLMRSQPGVRKTNHGGWQSEVDFFERDDDERDDAARPSESAERGPMGGDAVSTGGRPPRAPGARGVASSCGIKRVPQKNADPGEAPSRRDTEEEDRPDARRPSRAPRRKTVPSRGVHSTRSAPPPRWHSA